ncbi:MAG: hypothetical protein GWP17_05985, partial [Aquificales bacterium]|nr:hypothetical protein [Aquificales bacterium]
PGFDLFRVPARWLVLYGLGMALLAGVGFQILWDRWHLQTRDWKTLPDRAKENLWHVARPLHFALILVILLMAWNAVAGVLAQFLPIGPEAPYESPNPLTWLLWIVEIVLVYLIVAGLRPKYNAESRLRFGFAPANWGSPWWLAGLALAILFLASRSLPYNNLTTPEAWFDLRPAAARLLIDDTVPHGRLLSLSNIFFDPGDMGEINSIYADQLSEAALYDYTVAIKQKEIIAPNLPLAYGLASVDGFDGGILPLASYSQLMRLILPDGQTTTDGRLREHLSVVPEAKWLDLFNGRYLITDKTGDQWRTLTEPQMDVFFDLQHDILVDHRFDVAYLPEFPATALAVLSEGELGQIVVGEKEAELLARDGDLSVWVLPEDGPVQSLSFTAVNPGWRILGATLLNENSGTFMSLTLGHYRLIHSGDVKIYENLDVLPRAFFAPAWQWQPDTEAVLVTMAAPDFEPGKTAVLLGSGATGQQTGGPGGVFIESYAPERIVIHTTNTEDGLLLLTDANYPGWQASVDGEQVPIETADILFKSVFVPAGEHEVLFEFVSGSYENGRYLSLIGLLIGLVLIVVALWKRPSIR